MADRGTARVGSRRTERKKVKTAGSKKLGRVAQLAVRHNDEVAEEFIDHLERGRETRYELGRVTRAYGGGAFAVKVNGMERDASLRGMLMGRGRFHHNPEATTAVRVGSYVVVDEAQIMAALTSGQASHARKALHMRSAKRSSNSMGFEFNRSSEERRNTARRGAMIAGLDTRKRSSSSSHRSSSAKRKVSSWFW